MSQHHPPPHPPGTKSGYFLLVLVNRPAAAVWSIGPRPGLGGSPDAERGDRGAATSPGRDATGAHRLLAILGSWTRARGGCCCRRRHGQARKDQMLNGINQSAYAVGALRAEWYKPVPASPRATEAGLYHSAQGTRESGKEGRGASHPFRDASRRRSDATPWSARRRRGDQRLGCTEASSTRSAHASRGICVSYLRPPPPPTPPPIL